MSLATELPLWDRVTPLYLEGTSRFFFDEESLREHLALEELTPEDVTLVLCHSNHAQELDSEYFGRDLPDSQDEIPADLMEALWRFNDAIRAHKEPLSWSPTRERVTIGQWSKP